jgi:cell division protease FtsH
VTVGNPDIKGREAILRVHSRKVTMEPEVDLRSIARGTPGFSGADLANLVNEAALYAGRAGRPTVTDADLQEARDKVLMGVERRSVVLSEMDRVNCEYLETQIAVLMGGRVAEEIFMNHMTSGASNDIERATDIAQHMVCEFGMSPLGPLAFRKPGNAFEADKHHTVSEATAQRVDEAIRAIVMNAYDHATWIINRNKEAVRMMAELLLEQESIEAHEIKDVLARANAKL